MSGRTGLSPDLIGLSAHHQTRLMTISNDAHEVSERYADE